MDRKNCSFGSFHGFFGSRNQRGERQMEIRYESFGHMGWRAGVMVQRDL